MQEQLKLILVLREELQKVSEVRDEAERQYKTCEREMDLSLNRLLKLENEKCNIKKFENKYTDKKITMLCLFTLPIGIFASVIAFILNKEMPNILFFNIMKWALSFCYLGAFTILPSLVLNGLFPKKIENFLLKRFPSLEKYHNKINTYYNELALEDEKFNKLEIETDKLYDAYMEQDILLNRKTRELLNLEEIYFDSLGNSSVERQEEVVPSNDEGKGKRRVRVPNNKENLGD